VPHLPRAYGIILSVVVGRQLSADPDRLVEAILSANRVLLQVSVQALQALAPDVNLTEFRTLSVLEQQGPQRLVDLAEALEVTSTTATRLADHLVEQGLVERLRQSRDRREIHLAIAAPGRILVHTVHSQRRTFVKSALRDCDGRGEHAALRLLERISHPGAESATESA
jgi:DNA-binding MarR family transcriptional regulator